MHRFCNPIIPGFYSDPSICRVGEDYYLVTSTFEYFPGVPIFHSKDLVHWEQIGHVLDRPSQLNLDGVKFSAGIWAPTIRYHEGTFYMITTCQTRGGNFIVTAKDPAGDWSEPYWLADAAGIDPSLFFDDDKVYYTGNRIPQGGQKFKGHKEIWLQELNLNTVKLVGEKYILWDGALKEGTEAEAPHIYKVNVIYYLMISEGGTWYNHAVTISKSECITGPYKSNPSNPILTHRHLGREYPIVNTGHADLVQTQNGEWWMVALASRPYGGYYRNLGRETFLIPVKWEDDWPIVSPGTGKIEGTYNSPNLPEKIYYQGPSCDNFEGEKLDYCWNFLRTPREKFWNLTERKGYLRLSLRPEVITKSENPSFVGRRQQHKNFSARTVLDFNPKSENEVAGIVLLQNNESQYRVEYTLKGNKKVLKFIKRCWDEGETVLVEKEVESERIYLKVEAVGQEYNFYYGINNEQWEVLMEKADGRILSSELARGFVGAYIGMYASSNGIESDNYAYFDWFEYIGRD